MHTGGEPQPPGCPHARARAMRAPPSPFVAWLPTNVWFWSQMLTTSLVVLCDAGTRNEISDATITCDAAALGSSQEAKGRRQGERPHPGGGVTDGGVACSETREPVVSGALVSCESEVEPQVAAG